MRNLLFVPVLILFIQLTPVAQTRSVALLLPSTESIADVHSARHALDVAGVPYTECRSVGEAVDYAIIFSALRLGTGVFSSQECDTIKEYTERGGVFIGMYIQDPDFFDLFGISQATYATNRKLITWNTANGYRELQWINHPHESTIRLAGPDQPRSVGTIGYETSSNARIMARYDDGSVAVIAQPYGSGYTYGLGYNLFSIVAKNLMNVDYQAELDYSNVFEPTTDVIMLLFRGIYQRHVPAAAWKHTCPGTGSSALMITHDVDSRTGVDTMDFFTSMEFRRDIETHYFVTTHYNSDGRMSDYYDEKAVTACKSALDRNQHIGSHSVAHAPDMHKSWFPVGSPGNTKENYSPLCPVDSTTGGSLYGEVEVSKNILEADLGITVKSFRAGHLCYHSALGNVLQDVGYLYNSTFSAASVLTNFPYYAKENKSTDGRLLSLIEIPMTISDVFTGSSFNHSNYEQRVEEWKEVTSCNDANGAPTTLLIHPNRLLKVTAQEMYLDWLPQSISVVPIDSFGAFWANRSRLRYRTDYDGSLLTIILDNASEIEVHALSFAFDRLHQKMSVKIIDNTNSVYDYTSIDRDDKTYVAVTGKTGVGPQFTSRLKSSVPIRITSDLRLTAHPQPQTSFVYRIYDMDGAKIYEQSGRASSTPLSIQPPELANGMYMVHVKLGENIVNRIVCRMR